MKNIYLISIFLVAVGVLLATSEGSAQDAMPEVDEITVQFSVPGVGAVILPALLGETQIYLPITDVFSFLRIKMNIAEDGMTIDGFFLQEDEHYRVDVPGRTITKGEGLYTLSREELIVTDDRAYLRSDFYGRIFELECRFDFRALSVKLVTSLELPAIKEMIRDRARANLRKLSDSVHFDRAVYHDRLMFRLGALDWLLGAASNSTGVSAGNYSLSLGAEVVGGELSVGLPGSTDQKPTIRELAWNWHYVADPGSILRQAFVGTSSSRLPLPYNGGSLGFQLTNISPTVRKAFGSYVIDDLTEPEWTVELYINEQLVDFVQTDESGRYRFEIPITYGTSSVMLKFYGPWGEVRESERVVRIPFTFLPPGEIEYDLSGGMLQNDRSGIYARAAVTAGVTGGITLSGGAFRLSGTETGPVTPFLGGSFRLLDEILVSGEYIHGFETKGTFSYTLPSRTGFELTYSRLTGNHSQAHLDRTQTVTASLSTPLDLPLLHGASQMNIRYITIGTGQSIRGDGSLTTSLFGVPMSISTVVDMGGTDSVALQSVRTSVRFSYLLNLFGMTNLRPQIDVDDLNGHVAGGRIEIDRSLYGPLRLSLSVGHDLIANATTAQVGIRLDLSSVGVSSMYYHAGDNSSVSLSAHGGVSYDTENGYLIPSNRGSVGRGGLTMRPFLDINNNGVQDDGEPRLTGLDLGVNGGVVQRSFGDSLVRVVDMEPYRNYIVTVDASGFENIAWRPRYSVYQVSVRPNTYTEISVPVIAGGEVSGTVVRRKGGAVKGVVGVKVRFKAVDGDYEEIVVTSEGGEYYHLGLPPGKYVANIDSDQLRLLSGNASDVPFEIRATVDGDIVENLNLVIE